MRRQWFKEQQLLRKKAEVWLVLFCISFQHYSLILAEKVWFQSTALYPVAKNSVSEALKSLIASHTILLQIGSENMYRMFLLSFFQPALSSESGKEPKYLVKEQANLRDSPSPVSSNPSLYNCWQHFHFVNPDTEVFGIKFTSCLWLFSIAQSHLHKLHCQNSMWQIQ